MDTSRAPGEINRDRRRFLGTAAAAAGAAGAVQLGMTGSAQAAARPAVPAAAQARTAASFGPVKQMLTEMGFAGFAERARCELTATGETVRKRTLETAAELTAQEAQIARLAGEGHTNTAIGGRLFISGRTVEWHLHKIFARLGISSRKELREAVTERGPLTGPA